MKMLIKKSCHKDNAFDIAHDIVCSVDTAKEALKRAKLNY